MNKEEYLKEISNCEIDPKRIEEIEKRYNVKLDKTVKCIISYADKIDFFDEERRALSYDEILCPEEYLDFDFLSEGLIPLIDAYDNSYIVYILGAMPIPPCR